MSINIGQKNVLSKVPSTGLDKQQSIEINEKYQEELRQTVIELMRQILVELIHDNFVDKNVTFNTAQQYIEKISSLMPGLLECIKENKVDISLHATDALTRGDEALAQALFEFGADHTKVAATLAFTGEAITQVERLLNQGADPINTLAPLVLAVEVGSTDSKEAIPLLSKHLFAKEPQFNAIAESAAEAGNFIDEITIYALQHDQIEFADKLFTHANNQERILDESGKYLLTLCAEAKDSIQKERSAFETKQGAIQAKLGAIFKIFVTIANWFSSLSTRNKNESSHPLRSDLEKIPHITLPA